MLLNQRIEQVAIKVVDTKRFKNEDQKKHAENEKEICKLFQKRIKHQHIVDVLDVAVFDKCIYFVLEYVNGGELYERIKQEGRISEPQAKKWFRELIEAVAHIHKHGIVHRDLKPENVLVDKSGRIRLCDFGFGKIFDPSKLLDTYCGSPFYAAPEMVTATPYRGPPVDMWSCGVILYAMLTGQLPFHCDTMPELFKKISLAHYMEPNTLSEEALHLIKSLLCRNPKRRITAEGVLKHPWLDDQATNHQLKKMIRIPSAMSTTFKSHNYYKTKVSSSSYPTTFNITSSSPTSTLPSPVISVGDEELASYSTPSSDQQKAFKATRFLLNAINKKSQVAPSREKARDSSRKGSKTILVTAEKIKRFFTNTFIHRRLTST
ncbi:hypothetical protein INT48_004115 [Thamnidium elegans]|uniref:Protein kinase domain-containing protein n=1 Tax=Thamnidium elegans TaxID=101142 RepID=A0A8H7SN19_9FUNG|nr:hypothetical protein INT48_004115 [Thamnidium elegans]